MTAGDYNPYLGHIEEFIPDNMKLVHKIAQRYRGLESKGIAYEDIVSEGTIGMVKAFRKFDPGKFEDGEVSKFSTYAFSMILGEIQLFLRDRGRAIKAPRALYFLAGNIIKRDLIDSDIATISSVLSCSPDDAMKALKYLSDTSIVSVDQPFGTDDEQHSFYSLLGQDEDFTEPFVDEFLDKLPDNERQIVKMLMANQKQGEIGKEMGVSQTQISRLIAKIRNQFEDYIKEGEVQQLLTELVISDKLFKKGDIIKPADNGESPIFLVGFSRELKIGYGVKLTKESTIDSRTKRNSEGWNITVTSKHLLQSEILMRDVEISDVEAKSIKAPSPVQTRTVTPEESKQYGVKSILTGVEWFVDAGLTTTPSISVNKLGLTFNSAAIAELALQSGEYLQVGFNPSGKQLIIKKSDRGLKLSKSKDQKSSMTLNNKRMVEWFQTKQIQSMRYALQHDQLADVWSVQLQAAGK